MPVITVSGSLGSGVREIAQDVARELQLDYIDQEILVEAARQLGVSVAAMERHDERPSSMGERLASVMRTLMERSAAAGTSDPLAGGGLEMVLARTYGEAAELPTASEQGQLDDDRYIRTLASVIRGIAARGNVVILGRGSPAILQDEPEALHVSIVAQKKERVEAVREREGIGREEAERRVKQWDQNRQAFFRRYFKTDVENPCMYDLVIRAGRVRNDLAVKLISLAVGDRTPRPG